MQDIVEANLQVIQDAVREIATQAQEMILSTAKNALNNSFQEYAMGLTGPEEVSPNTYEITLNGVLANQLESGYASFDMKNALNSNAIVKAGPNKGKEWVHTSKEGKKYASVPFTHHPHAKSTNPMLKTEMAGMTAINIQGKVQKLLSTFKDAEGIAFEGKVMSAKRITTDYNGKIGEGQQFLGANFRLSDKHKNPLLAGLTKYQTKEESGRVASSYMTYRTMSEDSTGWIHPGYSGVKAFEAASLWVEEQLQILAGAM